MLMNAFLYAKLIVADCDSQSLGEFCMMQAEKINPEVFEAECSYSGNGVLE
jgi:hypothetical protein